MSYLGDTVQSVTVDLRSRKKKNPFARVYMSNFFLNIDKQKYICGLAGSV